MKDAPYIYAIAPLIVLAVQLLLILLWFAMLYWLKRKIKKWFYKESSFIPPTRNRDYAKDKRDREEAYRQAMLFPDAEEAPKPIIVYEEALKKVNRSKRHALYNFKRAKYIDFELLTNNYVVINFEGEVSIVVPVGLTRGWNAMTSTVYVHKVVYADLVTARSK